MEDTFLRYSRQIFIEEVGIEGQRKLKNASVLVVGAGGLGSPVIQYLAAAGVGTLAVADFDILEIHNLNRQVIHTSGNIGKSKVDSAATFVQNLNPNVEFISIKEKVTKENIEVLFSPYSIMVDCSDNFTTRYLINDTCVQMNKTLVYGSILAHKGQLAVFKSENGKNLRDIFPEAPDNENQADCDSLGVLGALPGIIGSMMALQTLQIILNLETLHNQLLLVDTQTWNFTKLKY